MKWLATILDLIKRFRGAIYALLGYVKGRSDGKHIANNHLLKAEVEAIKKVNDKIREDEKKINNVTNLFKFIRRDK